MPTARPGDRSESGPRVWLIPSFFVLLGLWMVFHVQVASGFRLAQPDTLDPRLIQYTLERSHRSLTGHGDPYGFWSPPIFFPESGAGAFTDSMVGLLPFYSPWRVLGVEPETAFQLMNLALLAACFVAAYQLFRRGIGASVASASVAAFLFAFALPRSAQLSHAQLFAHYATPIGLWGLWRAFAPEGSLRSRRLGVSWFFAAFVVQVLGSVYLAWFLALGVACGAAIAAAVPSLRRPAFQRFRRVAGTWVLAASLAGAFLGVYLAPYAAARERLEVTSPELFEVVLPRAQSFLYGGSGSWQSRALGLTTWPPIAALPLSWEHGLCPGIVTLALAGYGFWRRRRRPLGLLVSGAAGLALVLVLRWPGGFDLWSSLATFLPGAEAIRVPARIGLLLLLPIGLGVIWALDGLRRFGRLAVCVAVALVVVEQGQTQVSFPKGLSSARATALAELLPVGCEAFLYTPLWPRDPGLADDQLDAMFASLESGVPTLNGYSGYAPAGWWPRTKGFFFDFAAPADLVALAAELGELGKPVRQLCWLRVAIQGSTVLGGSRAWTDGQGEVAIEGFGRTDLSLARGGKIFEDGFESGDLSSWTLSPESGRPFDPGRAWQ